MVMAKLKNFMMVNGVWRRIFKWKKYGKGKEYDFNCNLIFEGEYSNGMRILS